MLKLEAREGSWGKKDLYLDGRILLRVYPEGDCDSICWPMKKKDKDNLAAALFDEYEMGNLKERSVLLPNGQQFNIDD